MYDFLVIPRVAPTIYAMLLAVWSLDGIVLAKDGDMAPKVTKGPRTSVGLRVPNDLISPMSRKLAQFDGELSQNDYVVGLIAADVGRPDLAPAGQEPKRRNHRREEEVLRETG